MITRKQWSKFIWDVYQAKNTFGAVFLHGRRVNEVYWIAEEITTIKEGEPTTRYTFEESLSEDVTMKRLYSSVTFNTSLDKMMKRYREIEKEYNDKDV